MKKKVSAKAPPKRPNVADGIENSAKRISASLSKPPSATAGWTTERILGLREFDGKVGSIPVNLIKTNENVRNKVDEGASEFKELVESIKLHGLLQAPIVTVVTDEKNIPTILLIGGERRLRAWKNLGHETINCLVKVFDTKTTRLTASMAENMNRRDLNPLEVAYCFESLSKQNYKYADIEKLFGRDEKTIGRYIKIARWPQRIRTKIADHAQKFNSRFLLDLASRTLTHEEVELAIDLRINGPDAKPGAAKKQAITDRVNNYFETKRLAHRDRILVMQALTDLGFLKVPKTPKGKTRKVMGATAQL